MTTAFMYFEQAIDPVLHRKAECHRHIQYRNLPVPAEWAIEAVKRGSHILCKDCIPADDTLRAR